MSLKPQPLIPKTYSKTIYKLSYLSIFTGLYGCYNGKPMLGTSVIVGSFIAQNYWRNPTRGLRRNIDILWIQFLICLHTYYVLQSHIRLLYFLIQLNGILFYTTSWYHLRKIPYTQSYIEMDTLYSKSTVCHCMVHLCANLSLLIYYSTKP